MAAWALSRLLPATAFGEMASRMLARESDAGVREELTLAS
jgi:hypothetical protein